MLDGESEREKPMRWGPEDPPAAAAEPHFTRDEPAFAPSRKGLPPRRGGGEGSGDEGGAGGDDDTRREEDERRRARIAARTARLKTVQGLMEDDAGEAPQPGARAAPRRAATKLGHQEVARRPPAPATSPKTHGGAPGGARRRARVGAGLRRTRLCPLNAEWLKHSPRPPPPLPPVESGHVSSNPPY
jgi:hypothetical protein